LVKGLGCGHLIAPVLAQLAKLEPPPAVFFDRTGRLLRVSESVAAVLAVLSAHGLAVEETDATAEVWYSRANILELSREEFRILARQTAAGDERVAASIDAAMDEALAAVSIEGGFRPEWTAAKANARDRVLAEAARFLQPAQLEALRDAMAWAG
jgi:phage gp16-like protein